MRRTFRRGGFRRRGFRRKTAWVDGFQKSYAGPPFAVQPVLDGAGGVIGHTVEIPLQVDELFVGEREVVVQRIVGDMEFLLTSEDDQGQLEVLPEAGAELRLSIQRRRVFQQTVSLGAATHSHLWSDTELGDEDILFTRRWIQPTLFTERDFRQWELALESHLVTVDNTFGDEVQTFDTWSNFMRDQRQFGARMFDTSARRRCASDNRLFMYVDVLSANGSIYAVNEPLALRGQGFLRQLVTFK